MAPKRRPSVGRVVGVVRSTRKVVKETVQVTIFDGQEEDTAADINLVDTEELNDFVTPEVGQKVTVRTIPVEEARGASKKITRKKRRRVGGEEGYRRYVYKVMKQVHPEMRISGIAMSIINSLMMDMFERIAAEAATLSRHSNRATISSKEIQGAVKLVLPGELGKHAIAEGSKAVSHYAAYDHNN